MNMTRTERFAEFIRYLADRFREYNIDFPGEWPKFTYSSRGEMTEILIVATGYIDGVDPDQNDDDFIRSFINECWRDFKKENNDLEDWGYDVTLWSTIITIPEVGSMA